MIAGVRWLWAAPLLVVLAGFGSCQTEDPYYLQKRAVANRPSNRLLLQGRPADAMRVHFIDVGQGDATLFEFPCGAILVDTGGEDNAGFNGSAALSAYLRDFFTSRPDLNRTLDALVITHPHLDHTRGVAVALAYNVRNIITNGQNSPEFSGAEGHEQVRAFVQSREEFGQPIGFKEVKVDDIPKGAGLQDEIIDPVNCGGELDPKIVALWGQVSSDPGWGTSKYGHPHFHNANNHSVSLRVEFGGRAVLVTGDLEDSAIPDFLGRYAGTHLVDVDIYQVGHHGSHNGTTPELGKAMSPDVAVFSLGPAWRELPWTAWKYGHPRQQAVQILEDYVQWARTPISVPVARGSMRFYMATIKKAIYGTAWDGTVIAQITPKGEVTVPTDPRYKN